MQCLVHLAVPAAGEPVPDVVAEGASMGGPGPGREVALSGEAGDVTGLNQEPRGTRGPDAVQVEQPRASGLDQPDELLVRLLLRR